MQLTGNSTKHAISDLQIERRTDCCSPSTPSPAQAPTQCRQIPATSRGGIGLMPMALMVHVAQLRQWARGLAAWNRPTLWTTVQTHRRGQRSAALHCPYTRIVGGIFRRSFCACRVLRVRRPWSLCESSPGSRPPASSWHWTGRHVDVGGINVVRGHGNEPCAVSRRRHRLPVLGGTALRPVRS
jgi:hypothetical protein